MNRNVTFRFKGLVTCPLWEFGAPRERILHVPKSLPRVSLLLRAGGPGPREGAVLAIVCLGLFWGADRAKGMMVQGERGRTMRE